MQAALAAVDEAAPATPGALLTKVGMTLVSTVGGAQRAAVRHVLPAHGHVARRAPRTVTAGAARRLHCTAGRDGVVARGKAEVGRQDDVRRPGSRRRRARPALADGASLPEALAAAEKAAQEGRDATMPMLARKGRASYLGERSVGHQDPGATSTALLVSALREAVTAADG